MSVDLDAIEARLATATPGPWFRGRENVRYESTRDVYSHRDSDRGDSHDIATMIWSDPDADLIAHAPTDLAALAAEARTLRDRLDAAERVVEAAREIANIAWRFPESRLPGSMRVVIDAMRVDLDAYRATTGQETGAGRG